MSLLRTLKFIVDHPLNKKRKSKALLGFVKWQIGSRLVPGDVIYNWVNSAKFIVSPGETGLTQNIYCGLHEFEDMAYVLHVLTAEDLFVDIGANVGSYTILACAVKGARGICFEPVPSTFQRLINNIKINDLSDRVNAYNIGLADKEDDFFFTSGLDTCNHVIVKSEIENNLIKVKVMPLDKALAGKSPSLIKIDVEGLEFSVLNGMISTLQDPSLHSVILELNGNNNRYGYTEEKIIEKMLESNFQMFTYEPFSRRLKQISKKIPNSGNTLFLRNVGHVKSRLAKSPRFKVGVLEI